MIVSESAGTGKTYSISILKQISSQERSVYCHSNHWIAAYNIGCQTLHSAAQLPIGEYRELQCDSLQSLRLRLEGKRFLIIDWT